MKIAVWEKRTLVSLVVLALSVMSITSGMMSAFAQSSDAALSRLPSVPVPTANYSAAQHNDVTYIDGDSGHFMDGASMQHSVSQEPRRRELNTDELRELRRQINEVGRDIYRSKP